MLSNYCKKIIDMHSNSAGGFEKVFTTVFNIKDIFCITKNLIVLENGD